jgi:hypothetical protein
MITLTNLDQFTPHILQLPRELRDLIWAYTVKQDSPIAITENVLPVDIADTTIREELQEAAYIYNTLIVTLSDPDTIMDSTAAPNIWGIHPQCKRHIRKLIFEVMENAMYDDHAALLTREHERAVSQSWTRKQWANLLELPRLENLTINMQKPATTQFAWTVFSPILIQLRKSKPNVCITFNISFDNILERAWNDEIWDVGDDTGDAEYQPMGFVDMSELVELPTHEDRAYVEEYGFDIRNMSTRLVVQGLLTQSTADKRRLAIHYVVREPQVLKVLMEKHYEVYKMVKKESEETAVTGEL